MRGQVATGGRGRGGRRGGARTRGAVLARLRSTRPPATWHMVDLMQQQLPDDDRITLTLHERLPWWPTGGRRVWRGSRCCCVSAAAVRFDSDLVLVEPVRLPVGAYNRLLGTVRRTVNSKMQGWCRWLAVRVWQGMPQSLNACIGANTLVLSRPDGNIPHDWLKARQALETGQTEPTSVFRGGLNVLP